ncbi:hypothetical protein PHLCEN_2v228 [Hermanssonia centrifuga]|uniref:NAD(P)-binding domain-containing protein n=1 Tax=Hermanssonia centrifuga TaxID=98765 RepID=A0A2R6S6P0_9APHY|nr:hypothetical protein PHLCEN_2v228 [Hermanssonia centrifuga]
MRREMPEWAVLPPNASEKTTTIVHSNFTSYPADVSTRLAEHDACIWALGKSSLGFSEADYTVLTYDYPMALIRTLKEAGVGENRPKDKPFRFVYISGEHADTTEKSSQMWARVKGRAENDLTAFATESAGIKTHILRPAYFRPDREYAADWANQRPAWQSYLDRIMSPLFNFLLPAYVSPLNVLSKVALEVAKGRWSEVGLFRNKMMRELSREEL